MPPSTAPVPHAGSIPIPPALAGDVVLLGWIDLEPGADRHMLLPSGLFMLSVFLPAAGHALPADGVSVGGLNATAGALVVPVAGTMVFAMLKAPGALACFRAPLQETAGGRVLLADLCGRDSCAGLHQAILASPDPAEATRLLAGWVEHRRRSAVLDPRAERVAAAAQALEDDGAKVDGLAAQLGVTRRQLERDFRSWLGIAPAAYGRLVRFQRAARDVAEGKSPLHAALDHGYADQAHMTRAFRDLARLPPRQLAVHSALPPEASRRRVLGGRVLLLDPHEGGLAPARLAELESACVLTRLATRLWRGLSRRGIPAAG